MKHLKLFESFLNENKDSLKKGKEIKKEVQDNSQFKDINGKKPKVGDFIKYEDGKIGKVKSFFMQNYKYTDNPGQMLVDFRSDFLQLNPNSKFEIIEADEKMMKAFESIDNIKEDTNIKRLIKGLSGYMSGAYAFEYFPDKDILEFYKPWSPFGLNVKENKEECQKGTEHVLKELDIKYDSIKVIYFDKNADFCIQIFL